ncbi:YceH family protein [Leucobacter massiliensis]|uniref:Uncharacterized protein n=1 Tax=Leucobacter massiliensis TaxID=1686285 RepID=A0A2S9QST8_9MICO|nr:YceH family protein [Leucobacter massiliensis]PRI12660.1 hypothetical protein B4915_00245 [Leucobacter massiliensis]
MSELPVLDVAEQRVLGSLLEKEIMVPGSYPMTVNSLRLACNQTSSREPVVDYDEDVVYRTLQSLRAQELAAPSWQGSGSRTVKYTQTLAKRVELAEDERALITVLLLRGPQPAGALKTQSERLHHFEDRAEVEACLARMAAAEPPLVRELPRQSGQRDARWVHLLGPVELPEATPADVPEPALALSVEVRPGSAGEVVLPAEVVELLGDSARLTVSPLGVVSLTPGE